MGKKLDAILGRSFKAYKFKALINLSISRLAVLKNQRQTRCSLARSDVVQLLNLSNHDRALLRVEQVIKEQNTLDVFVMIEGYCVLLSERVKVIENERECPDELKEAIASLVFAAARCGEFPELQEIRGVLTSRYGKEFIARAVELRNNCGVHPKMIQKLSTRQPSMEIRMKVLKEIADENGIAWKLDEASSIATEEKQDKEKENQPIQNPASNSNKAELEDDLNTSPKEPTNIERFNNSMNSRKQYKDVADAANDAFLSAAYAAAAARAAVELSRSSPRAPDSPNHQSNQVTNFKEEVIPRSETSKGFDKVHSFDKYNIDTNDEKTEDETKTSKIKQGVFVKDKGLAKEVVFDDSDNRGTKFSEDDFGTDNRAYVSAGKTWLNSGNKPISMRTRR